MVSVPWFIFVFPAGKGIAALVQVTTGRGQPSALQVTWNVVPCTGAASKGGTFVNIGRPKKNYQVYILKLLGGPTPEVQNHM